MSRGAPLAIAGQKRACLQVLIRHILDQLRRRCIVGHRPDKPDPSDMAVGVLVFVPRRSKVDEGDVPPWVGMISLGPVIPGSSLRVLEFRIW